MNSITFQHTGLRTKQTTQQTADLWQQRWTAGPRTKASFLLKKKRNKACSAAVPLPTRWVTAMRRQSWGCPALGLSIAFTHRYRGWPRVHLLIPSYSRSYTAWPGRSGNVTAAPSPGATDCHLPSTGAQPPAQALGCSPRDAASSSCSCQGVVAAQSRLFYVYSLYSDRIGNICTKSWGTRITPLSVAPFPSIFLHKTNKHKRWTGLWKHQSPGEGPAQLHRQTPHVLRADTENTESPLRKTQLPSVRLPRAMRMREGANKPPSVLCSSTRSSSVANNKASGWNLPFWGICSRYHNSRSCCLQPGCSPTTTACDTGSHWPPSPGDRWTTTTSASKAQTQPASARCWDPAREPRIRSLSLCNDTPTLQEPKSEANRSGACWG